SMKNILLIIIVISLLIVLNPYAEAAIVSGEIKNADGTPVREATVTIGNKFDFTDVNGRYRLKDVPIGEQTIQVKKGQRVLKEDVINVKDPKVDINVTIP
ncbi:MAG TPA: carboxypeptidase-like regulatory domain-containing protein, partial [Nitrospiria bacterium]|nr:carboxypeptidase-like regulatory domain-containing protein [Nitrospiria bacterium]